MTIDWKKYIDKVYIVNYVGQLNRYDELLNELYRVDMTDDIIYNFENINTPLYNSLHSNFKDNSFDKILSHENLYYAFDCSMGHYYCMKHAQKHNYKRILILENDVRFLKDKAEIKKILEESIKVFDTDKPTILLGNSNIVIHENNKYTCINLYNKYQDNKIYDNVNNISNLFCTVGAGFNIYNTQSMKIFCDYIESNNFAVIDQYNILYDMNNIDLYFTYNQICVQQNWILFEDTRLYNASKPTFDYVISLNDNKINKITNNFLWIDNVYRFGLVQEMLDKYVDKIYIVSYVKNKDERKRITEQLAYHGITNFEFVYTYDFNKGVNPAAGKLIDKHWAVSFAHYDCLKKAYELGYKRILVFEDDVAFLKDKLEFIKILVNGLYNKSDIVLYDYIKLYAPNKQYFSLKYQSGYLVNRKGMEYYIKNFENNKFIIDEYLYFFTDTNKHVKSIRQGNVPNGTDYVTLDDSTLDTTVYCVPKQLCVQQVFAIEYEKEPNRYIDDVSKYLI